MSQLSEQEKSKWADHFRAQRISGLSQKSYCEEQALKQHQFWYWKRKLEGDNRQKPKVRNKITSSKFVPVKASAPTSAQGLMVTLPNGAIVSGIEEHNHPIAQQLISTLK